MKLFKNDFKFQTPSALLKDLYQINDTEKNFELVNVINSGLKDWKEGIKEMSEKERKIEEPDKIVKIVEEVIKFNKQKQEEQGIKILTQNQMLSRSPISLAQLKAEIIQKNLKAKLGNYCILFILQKIWPNKYTII